MPRMLIAASAALLTLFLAGCGTDFKSERFYSMGTFVTVTLPEKNFDSVLDLRAFMTQMENTVKSATDRANRKQEFEFEGMMEDLMHTGAGFSDMTDGKFSVFAYTISSLYGFPEGPYRVPEETELETAMDRIDSLRDVKIDMGAYAKGYIVDRAVEKIREKGIKSALVNAGGDLYALGKKGKRKWRVAVKHPDKKDEFLSIANLENTAMATSGDYERYFETEDGRRIFHIFDASTGKNPGYYRSVSVIAPDTETADGLATVFFLLPPQDVEKQCKRLGTPVLLYEKNSTVKRLCGWENFEDK